MFCRLHVGYAGHRRDKASPSLLRECGMASVPSNLIYDFSLFAAIRFVFSCSSLALEIVEYPVPTHEAKLRERVFERSPMPIIVMDGESKTFIDCNLSAAAFYGFPSVKEVLGRSVADVSAPTQYDGMSSSEKANVYLDVARREGAVEFEWRHQRPDGSIWDAEVHLISFDVDARLFFQFSLVDITERKYSEKTKKLQRDLAEELNFCNTVSEGLARVLDAVLQLECVDCGGIYAVNPSDGSLEIVAHRGLSVEFVKQVHHLAADDPNAKLAAQGEARYGAYADIGMQNDPIRAREGLLALALVPIMVRGQLLALLNLASHSVDSIPESTRLLLETIAQQIGGSLLRLQADAALRESEEIFTQFMENSPVYIFFKDDQIRSLRLSRNYEQMLGRPIGELLGKSMDELFPGELAKNIVRDDLDILAKGKAQTIEEELDGRSYTTIKFPISIEGKPRYLAGYTIDVTERKQAEQALWNVQKLESLSLLAGGIAHDFNNLLGGVFGYVDLARRETSAKMREECLDGALAAIGRARALTQQLLTFAKGGAPVKSVQSVAPFLRDTVKFALSGSAVSCRFDIQPDLWYAEYDKHQIGQVIDNLVINAHQAMSNGGTIDIAASNIHVAEAEHPILKEGKYVRISIRDTGIGIPKEYLARIFDPFFTTKPQGHGLGLATCYSIVSRHGGAISVESEPGEGSAFHVFLPAQSGTRDVELRREETSHTGQGIFVVMDDEPLIRDTIGKMLRSFGYTPVLCEDGKSAIDYVLSAVEAKRTIVAMVFDLTVPGKLGGKQAAQEIERLSLRIPMFVASGYADDPVMANPRDYGFTASICKPFVLTELARLLNACLK